MIKFFKKPKEEDKSKDGFSSRANVCIYGADEEYDPFLHKILKDLYREGGVHADRLFISFSSHCSSIDTSTGQWCHVLETGVTHLYYRKEREESYIGPFSWHFWKPPMEEEHLSRNRLLMFLIEAHKREDLYKRIGVMDDDDLWEYRGKIKNLDFHKKEKGE